MESNGVCGIESKSRGIASELSLLQMDNPINILLEFVGWYID